MNFSTILAVAKILAGLLPLISGLVQQVETDLAGVAGTAKLQAVLSQVNGFLAKVTTDVNVIAAVQDQLTPLINGLVATYKTVGIFKSTSTGAPA